MLNCYVQNINKHAGIMMWLIPCTGGSNLSEGIHIFSVIL